MSQTSRLLTKDSFIVRSLGVALLLLLLSACGTVQPPEVAAPQLDPGEIAYVAAVDIAADAVQADVEAYYNATAVTFNPEAGFAVLGFSQRQGELTTLSVTPNQDAFSVPEVNAQGYTAWAGGYTAWAGGYTAWAGGFTAWAGGVNTTFPENLSAWSEIDLAGAHLLAPQLGNTVRVAVIDTGIDLAHPAFAGKLANGAWMRDYVDGDTTPQEAPGAYYGHGTAVAGIILQVAPNAQILPIRVLDGDGAGDLADVILAIDYAVKRGAHVINLSLGSTAPSTALRLTIEAAVAKGVRVVASAGNTGDQMITYPARWAGGMAGGSAALDAGMTGVGSVGSGDTLGKLSSFSSRGVELDLVAPGEAIVTTYPDSQRVAVTGTSFAAPIASGAMALALGENWDRANLALKLESSGDRALVELMNPGEWQLMGSGLLDAAGFMRAQLGLLVFEPITDPVFDPTPLPGTTLDPVAF